MWNHIILHAWRLLNSIWCWSSLQTEELKKHGEKQPFKMALCNCLTLMLVLEPPFDFGTCSLSKVWIAVLTPVLIFTYLSNMPRVRRQELLFRRSMGIYIFESASVKASTDLLLLHVTSHTDRHRDLGGCVPADFFLITHKSSTLGN